MVDEAESANVHRAPLGYKVQKITPGKRAANLRAAMGLDDDDPLQKQLVISDKANDKVKCVVCGSGWINNKSTNIKSHFDGPDHLARFDNYKRIKIQEGQGIGRFMQPSKPEPPQSSAHDLSERELLARENFVRYILIAGIPFNSMDALKPFLDAHLDFSIARSSDLADDHIETVLEKELISVASELKAAGFAVLGFDGTTHLGEASFFVVRYWRDGRIQAKCIGVKHADKSMDGQALCGLIKAVCNAVSLKYGAYGDGTLILISLIALYRLIDEFSGDYCDNS